MLRRFSFPPPASACRFFAPGHRSLIITTESASKKPPKGNFETFRDVLHIQIKHLTGLESL
jgi:hypothetical protein